MPSLLLPRYLLPAMSDKKSPPRKEKPIIVRTPYSDDKGMKRKLLSPGSPTHDDDDKRTPGKRKRGSFSLEASPVSGLLTTPKTPGSGSRSVPLSERQQLAMIMRMSDERQQGGLHVPEKDPVSKPPSPNPIQPVKKSLLDKKVHKRNERGELPLHIAAIKGDVKLIKKLIKAGADVNVADFAGWTPLHEASNRGWLYIAKQLLKAGADVNCQGLENDTPLHDAAINGHRKVVELLLKHGANPQQANSQGKTPLDVAASQEMVRLLKKDVLMMASSSGGSDSSSLGGEDARSPLSPDSLISKEDELSLDTEDSNYKRSGSFSNNQKLSMPKSPSDGKLTSPRLCLKFQRENLASQKSKDSKEPQYKSYSVTSVSTNLNMEFSGGEMFTPVDSPTSSIDSDLYNPGLESITNFSGNNKQQVPLSEDDSSRQSAKVSLMLPLIQFDEANSRAMELFPGQGMNNSHKINDKVFTMSLGGTGSVGPVDTTRTRTCESQSFVPNIDWSDSQREDSSDLPDIEPPQHIPSACNTAVSPVTTDDSQCNSVSSTGIAESLPSSEALKLLNQSVVTSTTGSNNLALTQELDRDITSSVRSVLENNDSSTSVTNNSVGTNSVSVAAQNSQVTSLKWELRSAAASPRSDDSSLHSNKSDSLQTSSPSRLDKETKQDKGSRPSSPKVPPLKIIIPAKTQATSSSDSNEGLKILVTNVKSAHPYVINPYQDPSRGEAMDCVPFDENLHRNCNSFPTSQIQPSSSSFNQIPNSESDIHTTLDKSTGDNTRVELNSTAESDSYPQNQLSDNNKSDTDSSKKEDKKEEPTPRVLRSSVRSQQQTDPKPAKPIKQQERTTERNSNTDSFSVSEAAAASVVTPASSNNNNRLSVREDEESSILPRKRKFKTTKPDTCPQPDSPDPLVAASTLPGTGTGTGTFSDRMPNPFDVYLELKRKILNRRHGWVNICPKIPQGFKDYLMRTCNYVLQGNTTSTLSVPTLSPPNSVTDKMRDLFVQQEEARYKLRLQHLIEREKLMLSIEQEMLREHGRAARALANQGTPLSVCTILRDEEIYNMANTEQPPVEEKDKKNRTRYNGRQFLSWLQDVDDKYEKIKELLILRQKQEADSLYAIQKLEWEWRLKELGHCDRNITPDIDELHVPLVQVTDNFDLLPT